jgi:hypothetical protein
LENNQLHREKILYFLSSTVTGGWKEWEWGRFFGKVFFSALTHNPASRLSSWICVRTHKHKLPPWILHFLVVTTRFQFPTTRQKETIFRKREILLARDSLFLHRDVEGGGGVSLFLATTVEGGSLFLVFFRRLGRFLPKHKLQRNFRTLFQYEFRPIPGYSILGSLQFITKKERLVGSANYFTTTEKKKFGKLKVTFATNKATPPGSIKPRQKFDTHPFWKWSWSWERKQKKFSFWSGLCHQFFSKMTHSILSFIS